MLIGHLVKSRYKVYDRLGMGGAATVYLARDTDSGKMVVVKVMHNNLVDEQFISRFKREIDLLKQIDNPHVIHLYDWGLREQHAGLGQEISYLVAEYIEGHTLADIVDARGPLDEQNALGIARQVALALEDIHGRGIVHRDVKSQNIMITADNRAVLIDFGIAKSPDHTTLTASSFFAGTLYYAAPEQILAAHDVDQRADIYSLGVVTYEMLMAALPVKTREFSTAATRIISGEIDPLADIRPVVEQLVRKMLAAQPGDRYDTAAEIVADIEGILGGQLQAISLPKRPSPRSTGPVPLLKLEQAAENPECQIVMPNGQRIPLERSETVIGRSHPRDAATPDIDLWALGVEDARTVSRQHCRVLKREGGYYLEELGSMNGTRLNEKPIHPGEMHLLNHGDQIMMGRVHLVFQRITH